MAEICLAFFEITAQISGSGITAPQLGSTIIGLLCPCNAEGGFKKKFGTPGSLCAFFISSLLLKATPKIFEGFCIGGSHSKVAILIFLTL